MKYFTFSNFFHGFVKSLVLSRTKVIMFVLVVSLSTVTGLLAFTLNGTVSGLSREGVYEKLTDDHTNSVVYNTSTMLLEDNGNGLIGLVPQYNGWTFGKFFIFEDQGVYYLWLNNKDDSPGARVAVEQRLESHDGLVWSNRLDTNLVDSTLDYHYLNGIREVIKEDDIYHGWESDYFNVVTDPSYMWVQGIRYITSTDGLTWDIVNEQALISGNNQNILKEGDNYLMWVTPSGDSGYTGSKELRFRMSTDPGSGWGDWETGGGLVNIDGNTTVIGSNRVRKLDNGLYQLFYKNNTQISSAISVDGINFSNEFTNLIDMNVVLPDFFALRDFVVVDMDGEDWFYFTYLDMSNNELIAVSRPEQAIAGLTAYNDSPTIVGNSTSFTATVSEGLNEYYIWDFGDGEIGSGEIVSHTYTTIGEYTAVVTASNALNTVTATTSVSITNLEIPAIETVFISANSSGIAGGVSFADEDIIVYDMVNGEWNLYFDGSDVGLKRADVDAVHVLDDGSILMSFVQRIKIPGFGKVDDSDILKFIPTSLGDNTSGQFEMYFDGSDVGLRKSGEDVDAIGFTPDSQLVMSTKAAFGVPQTDGGQLLGADDDLIMFNGTYGPDTVGDFGLYFDGSDVWDFTEDIWGVWLDHTTGDIYLSLQNEFTVGDVVGDELDVIACHPDSLGQDTSCTFEMFFDGSQAGFGGDQISGFSNKY